MRHEYLKVMLDISNEHCDFYAVQSDELQTRLQAECPHTDVAGAEYELCSYFASRPPFFVCAFCGLAEEQWHCGPARLKAANRAVSRLEGSGMIRGTLWSNSEAHKAMR